MICYIAKQNKRKFWKTRWDSSNNIRPPLITCNSGQHFAVKGTQSRFCACARVWISELFPVWRHSFRNVAHSFHINSEARQCRHDSDKNQTNKLEWWMILKISLRAKAGVPKTLVKRKLRLHSLYFPQYSLTLTESSGEFSDLHSIFKLRALHYC